MEESSTPTKGVRLQKLLASWGVASRRTIEEWMIAGRIKVNGELANKPGVKVNPEECLIEIDGKLVKPPTDTSFVVYAFYKPLGVISSLKDTQGRQTICNFLPKGCPRVYPIGRLDFDSSGLLLLTNDGDLTNKLLHPRYKVEKEYLATIEKPVLTKQELKKFSNGLSLDDGPTAPCQIRSASNLSYSVILKEGRNRQIRRMFRAIDREVETLHRIRFGPISIGKQKPGSIRVLSQDELELLRQATGS